MYLLLQDLIGSKKFPNNYLDVGISEQNLIGVAAGLASEKL